MMLILIKLNLMRSMGLFNCWLQFEQCSSSCVNSEAVTEIQNLLFETYFFSDFVLEDIFLSHLMSDHLKVRCFLTGYQAH